MESLHEKSLWNLISVSDKKIEWDRNIFLFPLKITESYRECSSRYIPARESFFFSFMTRKKQPARWWLQTKGVLFRSQWMKLQVPWHSSSTSCCDSPSCFCWLTLYFSHFTSTLFQKMMRWDLDTESSEMWKEKKNKKRKVYSRQPDNCIQEEQTHLVHKHKLACNFQCEKKRGRPPTVKKKHQIVQENQEEEKKMRWDEEDQNDSSRISQ